MPDTRPVHERLPHQYLQASLRAPLLQYKTTPRSVQAFCKGQGYISVSGLKHTDLADCKSSFSIETWIYISRTEALYSESSLRVRKHNGLDCDSDGKFLRWKCCGLDDPDPLSWCPVWEGDTQNVLKSQLNAQRILLAQENNLASSTRS